ncbi:MAG: GreA/GreB family elongation factor [Phycisphaerae bacterium]|nr:GreA/GreB family elongation factor [Phycisphaerae bacterium]
MQAESLVQLVGSGNLRKVEEEWERLMEEGTVPVERLPEYGTVLEELVRAGNQEMAEALAWDAIESVKEAHGAEEALRVAGPLLLSLSQSAELRTQTVALYREAFANREGLEALIEVAGLDAGSEQSRPVRRALRTVEVCLTLQEGSYLVGRDEDVAARVEKVDPSDWSFELTVMPGGRRQLSAERLADNFAPAAATDFRVQRRFASEELASRLEDDPAGVVIELCRNSGGSIDSDDLELRLVPHIIAGENWKKWWTKARAALKKSSHVVMEGRSPVKISYLASPDSHHDIFVEEFQRTSSPEKRLAVLESYIRDSRTRGEEPSAEVLKNCLKSMTDRASRQSAAGDRKATTTWLCALRAAQLAGEDEIPQAALDYFAALNAPHEALEKVSDGATAELVCSCLERAKGDDAQAILLRAFPNLVLSACDVVGERLASYGCGVAEFEPLVEQILFKPERHFEALLWLWDGGVDREYIPTVALITLLTRLLRTLDETRRSDAFAREQEKEFAGRARSVLSARKYERFMRCLEEIEPQMAAALRTQLSRCESLGRAVREDMLREVARRHPTTVIREEAVPAWKREDVIFVTSAGLARKQSEIEHHVNVKMRDNARAIGAAAEHGDLSENSEYKFALEERDLLRGRLAQMNDEVAKAKVLDPEDISTEFIGPGTRAKFRRTGDGHEMTMTFFGPWEADVSRGWYNYLAPLCQGLMGKRIGDVVEFDITDVSGQYEVTSIHNALVDAEFDI